MSTQGIPLTLRRWTGRPGAGGIFTFHARGSSHFVYVGVQTARCAGCDSRRCEHVTAACAIVERERAAIAAGQAGS